MKKTNGAAVTASNAREAVRDIAAEVGALSGMTTKDLQAKWLEVFGETARSRNRTYLQKRVAFMLQARAEGGLASTSLDRIDLLAATTPPRQRPPRAKAGETTTTHQVAAPSPEPATDRDPRLPPAGTIITRSHGGEAHEVTVLESGFEYRGTVYKSASAVAKAVTSSTWNGFLWLGLTQRVKKGQAK